MDQAFTVHVTQETFPPYDALHGTPHAMVRRVITFDLPQGAAEVEQTDYGHPGRFNPCHPKRIPTALQPRTGLILAAAEAVAGLLA